MYYYCIRVRYYPILCKKKKKKDPTIFKNKNQTLLTVLKNPQKTSTIHYFEYMSNILESTHTNTNEIKTNKSDCGSGCTNTLRLLFYLYVYLYAYLYVLAQFLQRKLELNTLLAAMLVNVDVAFQYLICII